MKKYIMPYAARLISSDALLAYKRSLREQKRRIRFKPHELDIFIRADDPYSFLLIQVLESFLDRFNVVAHYHVTQRSQPDMFPEEGLWHAYACHDAYHLARLYGLKFPLRQHEPDHQRIRAVTKSLVAQETQSDFVQIANRLLHSLWFDQQLNIQTSEHTDAAVHELLNHNDALLQTMGHYLGAMIHYGGEWYWGIDRLDHLEQRLASLGLGQPENNTSIEFDRTYRPFCYQPSPTAPRCNIALDFYWSARSPYSYLALERTIQLARHYKITLNIKPVLPMVMRNLPVPETKKMYIFHDTKREARKLGVSYGFVADPLGKGVERCYALYEYARAENKAEEYLISFARAVNAEGIHADTDRGMKLIVERCGLDWQVAKAHLHNTDWQTWAEANLNEMLSLGCWGVPSFRFGSDYFWGQDRLVLVERAMIAALEKPQQ
ncbi:DSBA-like thioredoxin domain-containing protein [Oleiphilus messinensis]|uniref:DSBA-like thioredoxin domain-containing protein n=1 Tax=Oleiphilus messinensis TaxID=141451 RepID=A0A1Y0IGD8_9GAMM|nr:DsbA family protein [Oleiphilus messinensis]ARU59330.1 DSBA-like thioredoxin domain-containing protein [Oleiphilus messinensis]